MILCLDAGNSQLFAGVFKDDKIVLHFRYDETHSMSADELGVFLKSALRENGIEPEKIEKIAICSVVPSRDYFIRSACRKYFKVEPFILRPGVKTGLQIKTANPVEVGADLIATAIAGIDQYPGKDLIIVDLGTATTFCAVNNKKEFLGVTIAPGLELSMKALQHNTAKLPPVSIVKSKCVLGRTTVESLQAGLYFGHLGMIREVLTRMTLKVFHGKQPVVIGTGGFASIFEEEKLFNAIKPDFVLEGLLSAFKMNEG